MSELALKLIDDNIKSKDTFLDLGRCGLSSLPIKLFDCIWLKRLNLGEYYLDESKKSLQKTVNNERNNTFNGPELIDLKRLKNLISLDLRYTIITNFSFLLNLNKLKKLDLGDNNIISIKSINALSNLEILQLDNNRIKDIRFLSELKKLSYLNLNNNQIQNIQILENFTNLQLLHLNNNEVYDISFLHKLIKLTNLDLSYNEISNTQSLEKLENLRTLIINNNKIIIIKILSKLNNLETLNLSNNQIEEIPKFINHSNLIRINLSKNQIINASNLEILTNLKTIDLSSNQINNISFIRNNINLEFLLLHDNEISDLSPIYYLKVLKQVSIGANPFHNINLLSGILDVVIDFPSINFSSGIIPKWFCDWAFNLPITENLVISLKCNYLNHKKYAIAGELLKMQNFFSCNIPLDIKDKNRILQFYLEFLYNTNQITSPPIEVFKQGKLAFLRYFEKVETEGTDFIYEAKLILIGDGRVGKTSLQRRLINENAPLPTGNDGTRGIKVFNWNFKDSSNKTYLAHIWDFGGQAVYYPVHRFFLTENAVYILMASTRTSEHKFEYWIPTIYQFGGKSPTILVQNCDNGNQKIWNDLNIFYNNDEYNLCKPHHEINLMDDNWGLKKLKSFIEQQIIQLPHIGKPVPKSWVKVREALLEKSNNSPFIVYQQLRDLCQTIDINSFKNEENIKDIGHFLHNLGILLWYYKKEELKNLIILKPEWVMNAVYKIIDDPVIQKQHGVIKHSDFERLWSEESYLSKIHELKILLQSFKIAFPKKHNKIEYLLPSRLIPIPFEKKWTNVEPYLRIEYHFEVMPQGIVNQLSAELSKYILSDESVWSNAVIFKNQDAEAQIIEEYYYRKIHIKAKGRDARSIMLLIMDSISDIVKEHRGIIPNIKVPCNCFKCQNIERPTTFEYEELFDLINKPVELQNKPRVWVTCNKSDSKLKIFDLLYSVGLEIETNKSFEESKFLNLDESIKENPEIFFSYAWDKEDDTESREVMVKKLYESLTADGMNVILDKENLSSRESIYDFMHRIGKGDIIVVAISDAYFRSINCMYEFYEIYKNSKLNKDLMRLKIYPIKLENINLSNPSVLDTYFDFWEDLEQKWAALITKRATRIGTAQQNKYRKVKAIASELGDFLDFISDINSKTTDELSKDNFKEIKLEISKMIHNK